MTTIDGARRRSTDDVLADVMTETGNGDAGRAKQAGKPLHFDAFRGLDVHRTNERPTTGEGLLEMGKLALAKGGGLAVDKVGDAAMSHFASSFVARSVIGGAMQAASSVGLLYELYSTQVEAKNREADKQRSLAASDAGVVALANALPFDAGFKAAVTRAHPGVSVAAAGMKARLEAPDHAEDLEVLRARADKGISEAAPLARSAAKELATLKSTIDSDLATAKSLRAQGREKEAASYESAARALLGRVDEVHARFLSQLPHAHADAAYGLGAQYVLHHALRVELGKESPPHFDEIVGAARGRRASVEPSIVEVRA